MPNMHKKIRWVPLLKGQTEPVKTEEVPQCTDSDAPSLQSNGCPWLVFDLGWLAVNLYHKLQCVLTTLFCTDRFKRKPQRETNKFRVWLKPRHVPKVGSRVQRPKCITHQWAPVVNVIGSFFEGAKKYSFGRQTLGVWAVWARKK